MRIDLTEAVWVEEQPDLDLADLAESSGLPVEVVQELADCGVLATSGSQWRFAGGCVTTVRTASRLRNDFELDANALALVMRLVDRVQELETEIRRLRAGSAR
jgi:chaperone modulatory protein CbpM